MRELRNDTAGVLRQVEAGWDVTITVHGQPVAKLVPVSSQSRRPMPRAEFVRRLRHQADPGLRDQLRELAQELTDSSQDLW